MDFPLTDLMDEPACYDFLVTLLHPDGLACPRCHRHDGLEVHRRDRAPLLVYGCPHCSRIFHAFTDGVERERLVTLSGPRRELVRADQRVMLVGFGVRAIYQGACRRSPRPTHTHADPGTLKPAQWRLARRPLLVSAMHGLAGSGALTALVVATLPSTVTRLSYLALFGAGSMLGMAALSGLLGWPLARLGTHHAFTRSVSFLVGCLSTTLGLWWGYPLVVRWL